MSFHWRGGRECFDHRKFYYNFTLYASFMQHKYIINYFYERPKYTKYINYYYIEYGKANHILTHFNFHL